ncbi:SPOR domain-containing protein [Ramlibacter tataouinensis]|uniref:SPOR domain-containing protein n=1 Tax=Ramlibacter tataouinensis TaxID=94132 RepID=UPI0022F3DE69|nr:SPOR domain-containing protein [Ramlibacter tataouinensis]WBY03093.1 SPOR domain-containing protein [Ramlibacter tataouinensis]
MAFFKFRKAAADKPAAPAQTESVETLRRRARHRLIGAAVLVLMGVLGFPLLFDSQPRPVAVDIPIEIPDRNKAKPLPLPVSAAPKAEVEAAASEPAPAAVAARPSASSAPARPIASGAVTSAATEPKPEPKPEAKAEAKPDPKSPAMPAESKDAPKAVAAPSKPQPAAPVQAAAARPAADADSARARALLEGKPVPVADKPVAEPPATAEGRFVVQVGAFSDPAKARETRLKVERAGLKTYTHVADTKDGKRTRVRVGPFATRAEADKAAGKIKALDLPAAILTL